MRAADCGVSAVALLAVCLLTVDVVSQGPPVSIGNGRISGRVLSSSSEAIVGATVMLTLSPRGGTAAASWTTTTGADGAYEFEALPEGHYALGARKPGDVRTTVSLQSFDDGNRQIDLQRNAHASQIDLVLRMAGSISGRIFAADGTALAGVRVMLHMRRTNGGSLWIGSSIETDALGRYRLADAPLGTYLIGLQPNAGTLVTVGEGAALEDVDVHDLPPPSVVTLKGQAVDETGAVPGNLRIEYGTPGSSYQGLYSVRDPAGSFTITDNRIPPGPVAVFASGETDRGSVMDLVLIQAVEGTNHLDLIVGTPGALRGRVVLERGALPLQSVQLALVPLGLTPLGVSERVVAVTPAGWFEADGLIGEHRLELRDSRPGWTIATIRRNGQRLNSVVLSRGELLDDLEVVIAPR